MFSQLEIESIILGISKTSQEKHLAIVEALEKREMEVAKNGLTEIRFESIGSSVGEELRTKSFLGNVFGFIGYYSIYFHCF